MRGIARSYRICGCLMLVHLYPVSTLSPVVYIQKAELYKLPQWVDSCSVIQLGLANW